MAETISFKINRVALAAGLERIAAAVRASARTTVANARLSCVKIEMPSPLTNILLSATDLDIGMTAHVDTMPASAAQDGMEPVLLPYARLAGIIRHDWSDTVSLCIEDADGAVHAIVKTAFSTFRLSGYGAQDFPEIPARPEKAVLQVPGQDLAAALERALFAAVKTGDSAYALAGVNVAAGKSRLVLCGTDTHRLSVVRVDAECAAGGKTAIVPVRAAVEIKKLAERADAVQLEITGSEIYATAGGVEIVARLINGRFPDYEKIIPTPAGRPVKVTAAREALIKALELAAVAADAETGSVVFGVHGGLEIAAGGDSIASGAVTVEAATEGEIEIRFNAAYLLDALRHFSGDEITIHMADGNNPALIEQGSFTHIIMPIRSKE